MYTVYVIISLKSDKFYIGQTDHLLHRYRRHLRGESLSTRALRPFVIGHTEIFLTRAEAMRREKELKTARGRAWIKQIVLPDIRRGYVATDYSC